MQKLDLNLSSNPFRNNVLLWVGFGAATVGLLAFTAFSALTFFDYRARVADLRDRVGNFETRRADLENRGVRALRDIRRIDVDSLELHAGELRDPSGLKMATTWGWGRTSSGGPISPQLLRVDIRIVEQDTCRGFYDNLSTRMVCSDRVGAGSCSGDSGGPINLDGKRVGIVSFGVGCADGWPGVYSYLGKEFAPSLAQAMPLGYSHDLARWVESCTDQ